MNLLIGQAGSILPNIFTWRMSDGIHNSIQWSLKTDVPVNTQSSSIENPDAFYYNPERTRGRAIYYSSELIESETGIQGVLTRPLNITAKYWLRTA